MIIHDCGKSRCVTYFLEVMVMLLPFCRDTTSLVLKGLTNSNLELSIDSFRTTTLPLMRHFGILDGLSLKINKRGCLPDAGGEVVFTCPIVKNIQPFQVLEEGRIKRVRGVAYCTRLSTQFCTKMIDKAREMLNHLLPDVWIYADHYKGDKTGNSPGFGIALVAETMKGHFKSADFCMDESVTALYEAQSGRKRGGLNDELMQAAGKTRAADSKKQSKEMEIYGEDMLESDGETLTEPEMVGRLCASRLLWECSQMGFTDSSHQHIPLLFMAIAEEHAPSKVRLGPLTPTSLQMLRHLKDFFGVQYDVADQRDGSVMVAGVGIGFKNMARHTF
eukprot:GDKJ01003983.1.p1 GENE.GDKJ01003983.1~~GDKJ01003983.1.p1  ORF type:complete len:382 (+),score=87.88 GDKJ01003983.1:149-1147(+)